MHSEVTDYIRTNCLGLIQFEPAASTLDFSGNFKRRVTPDCGPCQTIVGFLRDVTDARG